MTGKLLKPVIAAITLLAILPHVAEGHGGATGIVKQRMDAMAAMGKAMGAVADMFKGKRDFSADDVSKAGEIIIRHTSEIDALFPDNTDSRNNKHSDALPAVWQRRDEFSNLVKELGQQVDRLRQAAALGDQSPIRAEFGKTAKICSSCHQDFRKKKE